MATKASKVKEWALSKQGCGYVWGATGYVLTQSKLNDLIEQYPEYVSQSKNGKWLGKQCFDCAQFTRFAMKEVGITLVSGASSQWKKTDWEARGTIDTIPKDKVCILYRESASANPMQHTGIYLGDGYVMDARGSSSGVVYSKLNSYGWTHWAMPKGLYDGEIIVEPEEVLPVLYQAKVTAESGNTVRMRSDKNSSASVLKNIKLNEIVDVVEETDDTWRKIVYNGQTGFMMKKFLNPIETVVSAPSSWYVKIECGSEENARAIAAALKLCGNAVATQG